jgi:penicillin-binding protein 1A
MAFKDTGERQGDTMLRFLGFLFSLLSIGMIAGIGALAGVVWLYGQDLPNTERLASYQPTTLSRVYSQKGDAIAEYVRERRIFAPIDEVPDLVKNAFISAEDKNFYTHAGVDYFGIAKAMVRNFERARRGQSLHGASTITQQVMKNFLLSGEKSLTRKIKEAILAVRIEQTLSKAQILELYLNEIFLGANSYGIVAASQNYFGKALEDLTLAEAAYLAALPKEPSNLHPVRNRERAVERRNYVLGQMAENGHATAEEAEAASAEPLLTVLDGSIEPVLQQVAKRDYFTEEIRRQLSDKLGEEQVFGGGLSIRATLDEDLQAVAARALRTRLESWDRERGGYRGPLATLDAEALKDEESWRAALAKVELPRDIEDWRAAVVLKVGDSSVRVGIEGTPEDSDGHYISIKDVEWARPRLEDDRLGKTPRKPSDIFALGDVIHVTGLTKEDGSFDRWSLRQIPELQGAFMAMDPTTGRVLAMQGGFSFQSSLFNRATQAKRQPGSAFKPFVYAAALDNGFTPASIILDAPVVVEDGTGSVWRPQNYSNKFYGPQPMRQGIERSRNVMTVRLAQELGMATVALYAEEFGVYKNMPHHLSYALGAGETTLFQMVAAYAIFANGGKVVTPSLVDRVQDRWGRTIYRQDQRRCDGCDTLANGVEPWVRDTRKQIMDGVTAYQLVSMMQGVVQRGTARTVAELGFPVAGKTGTTNDAKDTWFIGFTPNLVAGCFIGYDQPRPMGKGATGGQLCAPVFKDFMKIAMQDRPKINFKAPDWAVLVKVDLNSGVRLPDDATGPNVVVEAFRPEWVPEINDYTGGEVLDGGFSWAADGGDLPMSNAEIGGEAPREIIDTSEGLTRPGKPLKGDDFGSGGLY